MKKIIVFYASYGGGHLSAARSIKDFIDNNYDEVETELIDCIEYISKPINSVTTYAYKWMGKNSPKLWGKVYNNSQNGLLGKFSSAANRYLASKLYKLFEEKKPDIIISAHPFSSQMTSYLKKIGKVNCTLATVLTDYESHEQWLIGHEYGDYFFVAQDGMVKELMDYGVSKSKITVSGIPISSRFLKTYNKDEVCTQFDLDSDKKVILFFGGGEFGLGKNRTLSIFKYLSQNTDKYQIVAISGRNPKMKKSFEELVNESNKEDIKIYEFTNMVPELMSISSLVITKPGGLTSTESLASGLPIIVINPLPGHEESNAAFLENNHAAVWIKNDNNIEDIISSVINNPDKLESMRKSSKALGKPNSCKTICETVLGSEN